MKKITQLSIFSLLFIAFIPITFSQVVIHTENFEGTDFVGYAIGNGSTNTDYPSQTFGGTTSDYIRRDVVNNFAFDPLTATSGNFIGLEDIDGAGQGYNEHSYIELDPINITGKTNLTIAIDVAFPDTSNSRYENTDFLIVDYKIDGGSYTKVLAFYGGNTSIPGMERDTNLNGTLEGGENTAVNNVMTSFTSLPVSGTGTTIEIRVRFNSEGSHEEMAFDNIILKGIVPANTAPVIAGTSAGQTVNDNATVSPFSAITTTDADGDNLSATITLDANAKGVLTGTSLAGTGPYTITSTTATDLQAKLRALTFNPTDNRTSTSETTTFTVAINDGNDTTTDNTTTVISNAIAPTVTNVSSLTANGNYKVGDNIVLTVLFSEDVTVSGTPQITLETGITDRTINYNGTGNGTNTLQFTYTVQAGDVSADLDYVATNSLTAGTSIQDAGGKDATLTMATPGASNSLGANKAIVIDGFAPVDPVITTPSSTINVNATTQNLSGTHTENGVTVHAYADADNNGTADNTTSLGSATVTGNAWSFAVNLTINTANNFVVKAEDIVGNTSNDVDVPTITEDSTNPTTPVVTTPSNTITVNTTTQNLSGTHTENGVIVHAYADADNNGTADNTTSLGSATVTGNAWSLAVNLTINIANNFVVKAEDTAGNMSNDVNVPTITQTNTVTWIGVTNTNWSEPSNWNTNSVPISTSDVIIPAGTPFPVTTFTSVTVNTINISSGASLIASSTINAQVTYNRTLPTTNWYLIAPPVNNVTQDNLIANHTFASGTGSNIGLSTFNNNGSTPWIYANVSSTGPIVRGYGASVKLAAPGNLAITGNINPFNVTVPITTGTRNNFNLLGNPYTSFINSFTLTNQNSSKLEEQTVWFWDGTQYITRNAMTPIQIAPTQGFFVEALNTIPGGTTNLTYSSANQSHQSDTFMKQEPVPFFELFVENGDTKKGTKVFYVANKTTGFDNGYDSKMFGGVTYNLAVFTQLLNDNDGRKLAIQTLPNSNFETMVIPVGLIAKAGKEITFSIDSKNLPNEINVYLEDKLNNTFVNLSKRSNTITLQNNAKTIGRFYLHTTSQKLESVDIEQTLKNVSIYKSSENTLTIAGLKTEKASISVYSILGKKVMSTQFSSTGIHIIKLPKIATGVYIVKLSSDLGKINKKIILE